MRSNPPHGGYPTPTYEEATFRRRAESLNLFGHPGASVTASVRKRLRLEGEGIEAVEVLELERLIEDAAVTRRLEFDL